MGVAGRRWTVEIGPFLPVLTAVLLLGALPALGESLAGATYRLEVASSVAASAGGNAYRVCVGAACLAVPPPAQVKPPGGNTRGGGGGGGAGAPEPPPVAANTPAPTVEAASSPSMAPSATPEPPPAAQVFLPPLPTPPRSPAPAPGLALPGPVVAVAAAGVLAALLLLREVAGRVPGAAAEEEVAVAPHTEVIGGHCPFCGDFIKGVGLIVPCPSCRAVHHAECWRENGGCTTLGCARAPVRPGVAEVAE